MRTMAEMSFPNILYPFFLCASPLEIHVYLILRCQFDLYCDSIVSFIAVLIIITDGFGRI